MLTILNIIPYIVSDSYLCEFWNALKNHPKTFYDRIPKYCLGIPNGYLKYTEHYCQYTILFQPQKDVNYFMLDIYPVEPILQEEISQSGIDIFKEISFLNLFEKLTNSNIFVEKDKLFRAKKLNTLQDLRIRISANVIMDLEYFNEDLHVSLVGYLDENLNIIKI